MKTNYLKIAFVAITMLSVGAINAQDVTTAITKQVPQTLGLVGTGLADGGTVRVVDNKGTIKFLQVKNGLTQVTNLLPSGGVVTTWQLGGKFVDDVTLDVNGKFLKFAGVIQNTDAGATSGGAVTTMATQATVGTSGLTLLMRDEATGTMVKVLATDLVKAGQMMVTATADGTAPAIADATIPADYTKVFVFRNGAKLVANTDYTVAAGAVTLVPSTTVPSDWSIYNGDVFETQWVR